jgi:hypothetical protein
MLITAEMLLDADRVQFEAVLIELVNELPLRIDGMRLLQDHESEREIGGEKKKQKSSPQQTGILGWQLHGRDGSHTS